MQYCVVPDESTQKDCICEDSSWEKIQMLPAAHIDLHLQTQMCATVSQQRFTFTENQQEMLLFELLHIIL